jgi:large conductance mechanosensitive channel
MARIKALWSEFKSFAFKGNMIDLAVAVVIGTAFSGVITSLVKDIIMPGVSYVVTFTRETAAATANAAQHATAAAGLTTKPATEPTTQSDTQPAAVAQAPAPPPAAQAPAAQKTGPASDTQAVDFTWRIGRFGIGSFVGSLINFLLVAFAVFIFIVKLLGSVMKRVGGTPAPSEPTTKECPLCLSVIPMKARRCAHCTADLTVPP